MRRCIMDRGERELMLTGVRNAIHRDAADAAPGAGHLEDAVSERTGVGPRRLGSRLESGAKPQPPRGSGIVIARDHGHASARPLDPQRSATGHDGEPYRDGIGAVRVEPDHRVRKRTNVLVAMRSAIRTSSSAGTATMTLPSRALASAALLCRHPRPTK